MFRVYLSFILSFVLAGQALAFTYDDCAGNTTGELFTITGYNLTCIGVAPADSTNDTLPITVRAKSAQICFDSDLGGTVSTAARMVIRYCPNGQKPAATPDNECPAMTAALTSTEGGSQDMCASYPTGTYYFDMTVAIVGGDTGRITIQGEGD